jgi:hypothetical protein
MLEGLPPNNAAHLMRLVSDERRARAVADLIVESFEQGEAASTAFETDELLPGGGPGADRGRLGRSDRALRDLRPDGEAGLGRQFARRPQTRSGGALSRSRAP